MRIERCVPAVVSGWDGMPTPYELTHQVRFHDAGGAA